MTLKADYDVQDMAQPQTRRPRMVLNIYDSILADLMSGKISPGSRLAVDTLAREFNVSHTPIREALTRLEAEGLVVKKHLIGYSAAGLIDKKRFDDIYDLRLALEPRATARVASTGSADDFRRVQDIHEMMQADALKGVPYSRYARNDAAFHDSILEAAGNALVRATLVRLRVHFHLFRLYYHVRVMSEASDEHARILDSIIARDPEGAEAAMTDHLERSRDRFRTFFDDV